jgi:hypothetical protein
MMEATKEAYLANMGRQVKLGRYLVTVTDYHKEGRSGTWERGFKFTRSVYGMLSRKLKKNYFTEYSCDHGKTWASSPSQASKVRSGKILLDREQPRKEFAFDSIQEINRDYDPSYKWHA